MIALVSHYNRTCDLVILDRSNYYVFGLSYFYLTRQKIEEREALVRQRIDNVTSMKDKGRLMPKGSLQERREGQRR